MVKDRGVLRRRLGVEMTAEARGRRVAGEKNWRRMEPTIVKDGIGSDAGLSWVELIQFQPVLLPTLPSSDEAISKSQPLAIESRDETQRNLSSSAVRIRSHVTPASGMGAPPDVTG